jgi:colanic acid/amylovoran biosynthesis glycosyltransferase
MKRVAQIFGTSVQPYLKDWTEALSNDDLNVRSFLSQQTRENAVYSLPVLGTSIARDARLTRLMSMTRHPSLALRWLKETSGASIRHRFGSWAAYSPLITYQPHVVHLINSYLYEKFAPVLSQTHASTVVSFRGYDTYIRPFVDPAWKEALTMIFDRASSLHFVSHNLMQEAIRLGAPESKCRMIYPGIKPEFYRRTSLAQAGNNPGHIRLVSVGRLTWEKGYLVAIQAVRKLLDEGCSLEYQIIGDGPQKAEISYHIRQWSLGSCVILRGALSSEQIRQVLTDSDIYLQPSLSEALGVAVLEASAMELPVMCTSAGGLPEAVDCDATGFIVPPSDHHEVARAIAFLVENPELRRKMGKAGRERVERHFSLDSEVRKWQRLYSEVAR